MLTLPAFTLPSVLPKLLSRLPQHPPCLALTLALNAGLNRIVSRETLAPLEGHTLRLCVKDAGLSLHFGMVNGCFRPLPAQDQPALTLRANTRDFIALALREEDPDTLFFSRRLSMEGDTELGLLVKNTLDAIDWDTFIAKMPLGSHLLTLKTRLKTQIS